MASTPETRNQYQPLGSEGYPSGLVAAPFALIEPLLAIGEGTNELRRIVIARELVKRNPV